MIKLSRREIAEIYGNSMNEAKARIDAMKLAIQHGNVEGDTTSSVLFGEMAYLQLRKACELVAIATLCAHNELPDAGIRKSVKDYSADAIFNLLSKINDLGFPHAVENSETGYNLVTEGKINRIELNQIYVECHRVLHAMPLKGIIGGEVRTIDYARLTQHHNRLIELLAYHAVPVIEARSVMFCRLHDLENGGNVTVHFKLAEPLDKDDRV